MARTIRAMLPRNSYNQLKTTPLLRIAGLLALQLATPHVGAAAGAPVRAERLLTTAVELEPNVKRGGDAYRAQCAQCHGDHAQGNADTLVPALASQRRPYLLKQLADFTELDRTATQMHRIVARPQVSEPQVWADVASYLNGLPPQGPRQHGNGEMVSLGEASYRQWCSSCHEVDARGDDEGYVPSLRDQHYSYLLGEMRGLAAGHRLNADPELVRFLDSLETDDMTGIADYLSRLTGPVRDRAHLRDDGTLDR